MRRLREFRSRWGNVFDYSSIDSAIDRAELISDDRVVEVIRRRT